MSTKIYSGFKAKNVGSKQLMQDLLNIQSEAKNIARQLSWDYQAFKAVVLFDEVTLGLAEKPKYSYIGEARANLLSEQQESERTNSRKPEVDYSFSICVYPIKNNEFLGVYFTEWEDKYLPLIKSKPWYQEYSYWNNTDKPEHITNREWKKRRKDWEILKWGVPVNECMLTLECVKSVNFGDWITKDSEIELVTFEKRVHIFATRQLKKINSDVDYFDFYKQLKDGAYASDMERIKAEIRPKLVENLTLEMLLESS